MGVLIVPLLNVLEDFIVVRLLSLRNQLVRAALCPHLRGRGEENLHRGLGQYHGADVPAVHDDVVLLGHFPLHVQQQVPDDGVGRNETGLLGKVGGADIAGHVHAVHDHVLDALVVVLDADGQLVDVAGDAVYVLGTDAPQVEEIGHGAVNRPGVHVVKAQLFCKSSGDGGLSRPGGAVNGDGNWFCHIDFLLSISLSEVYSGRLFLLRPPRRGSGSGAFPFPRGLGAFRPPDQIAGRSASRRSRQAPTSAP